MPSGIYQIRNQVNGKRYIGSTIKLRKRRQTHFNALRHGQHHNRHLQAAFAKYGQEAFVFSVLEEVKTKALLEREQYYLETLKPEYNIALVAGSPMLGRHPSLGTRKKLSEALIGRPHSKEHSRKVAEAQKGKHISLEMRARMSAARMGNIVTEETRRKISLAHKGKHRNAETCRRISESKSSERNPFYGKTLSAGHRRKISEALTGRLFSEEHRRKLSEAAKAQWRRFHATENKESCLGAQKEKQNDRG